MTRDKHTLAKQSFFQRVLERIFPDKRPKLINFECKPVVATGDSYTSNIKRVYIKYTFENATHQKSEIEIIPVILKTQVRGTLVEDWTIELDFFKTEIEMFCMILPKLEQIIKNPTSKCYLATDKPDFTLVLEDLQPHGYEMMDRQKGFDMVHTKGVLKTLAEYHAGTIVLGTTENEIRTFTKGLFSDSKVSTKWMADGLKSLTKTCLSLPECKKYGDKLKLLGVDESIKRGLDAAQKSTFNVLNHGDMWANNMLFLHDKEGNLLDTKLIDFQLVKYASPAVDLHYFNATSLMYNVRDELDAILDYYYAQLIWHLVKFGHSLQNVPSRKELQKDFEERAFYGVIALATVAPLVKSPPHKDANFDHLCQENDGPGSFRDFIYSSEQYNALVKQLMPYYCSLGIFDQTLTD